MNLHDQQAVRAAAVVLPEPWQSTDVVIVLPTYQESANLPVVMAGLFDLPLNGLRVEMSRAIASWAKLVVQMNADLSHPPEYLPQMIGTLLASDADVVIGSRYVIGARLGEAWPWYQKALSSFANFYVRVLLKLSIRDATAGFKVWRSSALEAIGLQPVRSNGYSFQVEMNYRALLCGLKIVELPIRFTDRLAGTSKMSLKVQLESALMPFKLRRTVISHPGIEHSELASHG